MVRGNLLVPEALADPETNKKWFLVNIQLLLHVMRIKHVVYDGVMVRTLSPGGPGGPSFPELP